jgi:hypothetical protein
MLQDARMSAITSRTAASSGEHERRLWADSGRCCAMHIFT